MTMKVLRVISRVHAVGVTTLTGTAIKHTLIGVCAAEQATVHEVRLQLQAAAIIFEDRVADVITSTETAIKPMLIEVSVIKRKFGARIEKRKPLIRFS